MIPVAIVDTRCANLTSVIFALERLGVKPVVTADPAQLQAAQHVILPGVGHAQAAMRELERLKLQQVICELQQPVLGICLGMQLLTQHSAEGDVQTLGLVQETTQRMQVDELPLPHMGWNKVQLKQKSPLLDGLDGAYFYFVHSYAVSVGDHTLASCLYGQEWSAVVKQENFYGAQFHPERSGAAGARLLKNFLQLEGQIC